MKLSESRYKIELKQKRIMMVGNYGSGKTEVSVNLAFLLRAKGEDVSIADLDVVNPYFRCREALDAMEKEDIRVVIPAGNHQFADLPIVMPEIKGMLQNDASNAPFAIFDVGGDDVGALLLSAMREALGRRPYDLLQVINTNRPFTSNLKGCLEMKRRIETAARLRVTGLVVNSHLMDETTPSTILDGYEIAQQVSAEAHLPIAFVVVTDELADAPELECIETPILRLNRRMTPPWDKTQGEAEESGMGPPLSENSARLLL
jgi:energy-coupling factor transporter ATP-binding protein EcfA2